MSAEVSRKHSFQVVARAPGQGVLIRRAAVIEKTAKGPWETDLLYTLAKHKVIPATIVGSRNPYTRSHLFAAEFGGQLKFSASDNIRYRPETLEYGKWQESETRTEEADAIQLASSR